MLCCNEVWVSDHTQLNLLCIANDGRIIRPWITVFQDLGTKAITGFTLVEKPSSDSIALAFRHAVLPKKIYRWKPVSKIFETEKYIFEELVERFYYPEMGLPRTIYIDNGRDYRSKRFWNSKGIWVSDEEYIVLKNRQL